MNVYYIKIHNNHYTHIFFKLKKSVKKMTKKNYKNYKIVNQKLFDYPQQNFKFCIVIFVVPYSLNKLQFILGRSINY